MFRAVGKAAPFLSPVLRLNGDRVFIRRARSADWIAWAAVRQENAAYLKPFEPSWAEDCLSRAFFDRRLERQRREREQDAADSFLIFSRADQSLIGGMNINHICRGAAQYASLGYWIAEDRQGQGLMSEALALTLDYCFEILKLHRVHAACLLDNRRSIALLRRAGFAEEGLARNYLKINGLWQDHFLFGMTEDRWAAARNGESGVTGSA